MIVNEFLKSIKGLYNTDTFGCFEVETNKDIYKIKLPCTVKEKKQEECEKVYLYTFNIKDWCRANKINTMYYYEVGLVPYK